MHHIHLVIEKGTCLALNLDAVMHDAPRRTADGKDLFRLTITETAGGEFVGQGMLCTLKVNGEPGLRGRVETVEKAGPNVNLLIRPL
jgi:hypothetical protein